MKLVTVTAPAAEPISLNEAKLHLRVDIADENTAIESWITAARLSAERFLNRALVTQTFDLFLDCWPAGRIINVPRPPLQSVSFIKYTDDEGNESTLPAGQYLVSTAGEPGQVVLKNAYSWPSVDLREVDGIQVRFVAGYGNAAAVPANFKTAMYLWLGDFYENRENTVISPGAVPTELPAGAKNLLWYDRFFFSQSE